MKFEAVINLNSDNIQAQHMRRTLCANREPYMVLDDGNTLDLVVSIRKPEWNFISYGSQYVHCVIIGYKINCTLSEAIGSLGCRRNSSSGSVSIKQLAEAQLLTSSETADPGVFSVYSWTQGDSTPDSSLNLNSPPNSMLTERGLGR